MRKFGILFSLKTMLEKAGDVLSMKRPRTIQDEEIKGEIAKALRAALQKRGKTPEEAAKLLQVEVGTIYKYLAASMIPGGHVLWRACNELGMILDEKGLRLARRTSTRTSSTMKSSQQYDLPFVNESIAGDRVHLTIGKKDSKSADYVHVALRIRVAG